MKIFFSIFLFFLVAIITSDIKIEAVNFEHYNLKYSFEFRIELYFFKILKVFFIKVSEKGIKIFCFFIPFYKINVKKDEKKIYRYIKLVRKFYIKKFNFMAKIGTGDMVSLAYVTAGLSGLMSSYELLNFKKINTKNFRYKIIPNFNEAELKIKFNGEIDIPTFLLVYFIIFNK